MVSLVLRGGAGEEALGGLGGVQPGVQLKQEVKHSIPPGGGQGEWSALVGSVIKPQWDASNQIQHLGLYFCFQTLLVFSKDVNNYQ